MKFFKKKEEEREKVNKVKALDTEYRLLANQQKVDNIKAGKDYENLTINKNLALMSEIDKNEAEKKKAESQTQSKFVNGVQVGCTVITTAYAVKVWKKDQESGNATRTEVGKLFSNAGKTIVGFFKKK